MALTSATAETPHEQSFQDTYGTVINDALDEMNKGAHSRAWIQLFNIAGSGTQVTFQGLGFRNGYSSSSGGCVSTQDSANVTFLDSSFVACEAAGYGGAVYALNSVFLTVTNLSFTGCSAEWGGAIEADDAKLTIEYSTFASCSATYVMLKIELLKNNS